MMRGRACSIAASDHLRSFSQHEPLARNDGVCCMTQRGTGRVAGLHWDQDLAGFHAR